MFPTLSRRQFIQWAGTGTGIALLSSLWPLRFTFAATPGDKRLLVIIMRGAMDGLAAVIPVGDKYYATARGDIALPIDTDTLFTLDRDFALHQAFKPILPLYQQKELLFLHATATPYRDRSHFDAQDLLENGGDKPHLYSTGWLNRAVAEMLDKNSAIAFGASIPLILHGDAKVLSWSPSELPQVDDDFLSRVAHMYQVDALLSQALSSAEGMRGEDMGSHMPKQGPQAFIGMMQKAAVFFTDSSGMRIGTIDIGGWDTHANQGLKEGRLANNFDILARGIASFRSRMGEHWKNTAVIAITEFGRTVKGNGTGGTDHGTASVALLAGGSVNGGMVIGDWPGLNKLYEGRDLYPVNDLRCLLKAVLRDHLGIPEPSLSQLVFPGSVQATAFQGLFVNRTPSVS